jgi:hypothetical protein
VQVVAFSTDNGPEEPMIYTNGAGSTGPFRGRKRSLYEGGVRLPFIMAYPGHSSFKGRIDHSVVGAVDWLPTVLSLASIKMPAEMANTQRGYDISDLFVNRSAIPSDSIGDSKTIVATRVGHNRDRPLDKPLMWEWRYKVAGPCWNDAPQLAIRFGRYKLLMDPPSASSTTERSDVVALSTSAVVSGSVDAALQAPSTVSTTVPPRVELYDFGPSSTAGSAVSNALLFQSQNIAALLPDVVANLSATLLKWHSALPPGPVDPHPGCGGINWPTGVLGQPGVHSGHSEQRVFEDDPADVL